MGLTALFGGTFNPPHKGHAEILEALDRDPAIDEAWLMPDRIPPHKQCDFLAEDADRINMCRILASGFKKARLCLAEFEREGKSYSIDTVRLLKKRFPGKSFAFVCGGDMLTSFDKWHKYDELMLEVPFIVFRRSGTADTEFEKSVKLFSDMGMQITVPDCRVTAVSSTLLRKSPEEMRRLVPKALAEYITDRGIYNARQ